MIDKVKEFDKPIVQMVNFLTMVNEIIINFDLKQELYEAVNKEKIHCGDCGRVFREHGILFPDLYDQSLEIFKDPQAFMQRLLIEQKSLRDRWSKVSALTLRYFHPGDENHPSTTFNNGPAPKLGVWARGYLMAMKALGISPYSWSMEASRTLGRMDRNFVWRNASARYRRGGERFRTDLEKLFEENTDRNELVSVNWKTDVPPIGWETIVEGEITKSTQSYLNSLVAYSEENFGQGRLSVVY